LQFSPPQIPLWKGKMLRGNYGRVLFINNSIATSTKRIPDIKAVCLLETRGNYSSCRITERLQTVVKNIFSLWFI
jgi:hypothetical protein